MDNIYQRLSEYIFRFQRDVGHCGTRIYLGRLEYKELINWAKQNNYCLCKLKRGPNVKKVMGLIIFEVVESNHIKVCYDVNDEECPFEPQETDNEEKHYIGDCEFCEAKAEIICPSTGKKSCYPCAYSNAN